MEDTILELKNIEKHFGNTEVLNGITISVKRGEFITLLGPSGCGKTTTLRIIAGLESPDRGQVLLNGQDVTQLPPEKRDVHTVFQSYALFPHMTVEENVGYSLKIQGFSREKIRSAVADALRLVQLENLGKRMPSELSGGQKQRVAIARALIGRPSLILLDEPLGALDLQLRRKMQLELKNLQMQLHLTFIYITHDQEEALTMSDRIAVMREGSFQQIGTPAEIYDSPRTSYVAEFVGQANILRGTVRSLKNSTLTLSCCGGCARSQSLSCDFREGDPVTLAVRSESIQFTEDPSVCGIPAVIREKSFAGGMLRIGMELADGSRLTASRHGINLPLGLNQRVTVYWAAEDAIPVDVEEAP